MKDLVADQLIVLMPLARDHNHIAFAREPQRDRNRAAPIRFDEEIETAVRTARLGRTSLTFELAIFGKGEEQLRASGEIVYVNADRATHEATPIPSALEALIRAREYGQ